MKPNTNRGSQNDSGFALFIVLSFLLIATAITIPFLTNARIEALVSRNTGQMTKEKMLVHGVLQAAALRYFELYQNELAKPVRSVDCNFAKLHLEIDFQDHSGLIDLNAASPDVLALGLVSFEISNETATALADEVVRYRSVKNLAATPSGGLSIRNGYKYGLFEHVGELNDLFVASGLSVKNIDTIFTVYLGTGTVDETAAPKQFLTALEKRAASDRYFIVNDTRRTNAITVSATTKRPNALPTIAKAVFGRGQDNTGVVFLSPMSLARMPEDASDFNRGAAAACEAFFDPQILQVLGEAVS
jgi:type II secretory pathway component PulK